MYRKYLYALDAFDDSRGIGQVRELSHKFAGVDVPGEDHESLVREALGTPEDQPDPASSGCG